jgi:hypothetical protein
MGRCDRGFCRDDNEKFLRGPRCVSRLFPVKRGSEEPQSIPLGIIVPTFTSYEELLRYVKEEGLCPFIFAQRVVMPR